jgi:hypothetical protein
MAVSKFFPMREPAWLISPLAVAGDSQSEAAGHRKRSRQGGLPVVVSWAGSLVSGNPRNIAMGERR